MPIFQKASYQTMAKCVELRWLSGVWHHAITTIAFYTRGHSTRQRVRDCDLKELAMPDLDQIKQEEQGARDQRGRFARGRSGNPAGRAAAATASKPRCPAFARRRGRGADPQGRRAGARRRPAPLWAVPRTHPRAHRERGVEFTMPPIRNASDLAGQRVKADPMEAGKIRTLRWSRE